MLTTANRKDIIESKKIICSELAKIQKSFYDEEVVQYYKDQGELSQFWEMYDCYNREALDYPVFHKVITINHTQLESFTATLTQKLTQLFEAINATDFIVVSHFKLDFFGNRDNDFAPLDAAYNELEKVVGGSKYNEAFKFNIQDLLKFVDIFFWITRCDPSAPEYIFLFDSKEQIQLNLCKYGNLHITEFNVERLTEDKLAKMGFSIITGPEFDNFDESGKIEGRVIEY